MADKINKQRLVPAFLSKTSWRSVLGQFLLIAGFIPLASCVTYEPQIRSVIIDGRLAQSTSGEVELIRAGTVTSPQPGALIEIGDEINTGANAQAVLLLDGGKIEITMLENTSVRIGSIEVLGEIFVRIKDKLSEYFEVKSEYDTIAIADGTEFVFRARDGMYRCTVIEGKVRLESKTASWPGLALTERETLSGQRGARPDRPRRMDPGEFNEVVARINHVERIYRPGAAQLIVPDLTGMQESAARRVLADADLKVAKVTGRIDSRAPIGEILKQTPAAGQRIRANQGVNLDVKVESTEVPSLRGLPRRDAQDRLRNSRLEVGQVRYEITGQFDPEDVVRQDPPAGRLVPVGSEVNLWLEQQSVAVPKLTGLSLSQAEAALDKLDLWYATREQSVSRRADNNRIMAQSISVGKRVEAGTRLTLTVGKYEVTVPSLIGLNRTQALARLTRANLRLGKENHVSSDEEQGTIISQNPRAGSKQAPSTSVDVVYSGITVD